MITHPYHKHRPFIRHILSDMTEEEIADVLRCNDEEMSEYGKRLQAHNSNVFALTIASLTAILVSIGILWRTL